MRVVRPAPLTLVSSNVPESPLPAWNPATAYTMGETVSHSPSGTLVYHEYEALGDTTGDTPVIGGTVHWLDLGPANARAMFDPRVGTRTEHPEVIDVTVAPGVFFDQIALARVSGVSVRVLVTRAGATLFDHTYSLLQEASRWSDYFFDDLFIRRDSLSASPAIFFADAQVRIIITTDPGATAACGVLLIGRGLELGITLEQPVISIEDYSSKETDLFGNTYLLERPYSDLVSAQLVLDTAQVDTVKRILATLRATPVLYDLNNADAEIDYDALRIFGFFENFSVTINYPGKSYCRLDLQSLL